MDQKTLSDIVTWVKSKVDQANLKGVIVGVSGGIDSAVVLALAKKAFPESSLGVWIGVNSSTRYRRNSLRLFEDLNVNNQSYDLTDDWKKFSNMFVNYLDIYKTPETYQNSLKNSEVKPFDVDSNNLSPEAKNAVNNVKARLRSNLIYSIANLNQYMVLGTTNSDELLIGYFTKWGDICADIYPILDFSKSEVYDLAKLLNINERIISTPPSADLFENQTDESDLGFTYDDIKKYRNKEDLDPKKYQQIDNMIKKNKHKSSSFTPDYFSRK